MESINTIVSFLIDDQHKLENEIIVIVKDDPVKLPDIHEVDGLKGLIYLK